MTIRTVAVMAFMICLGCGKDDTTTHIVVPWQLELGCNPGALDAMEAVLYVDNSTACPLRVSATDYSVSGECPEITPALVRPLILEYRLPHTPKPIPLAYIFSSVDLRVPTSNHIAVDLTTEEVIYTQSALEAIVIPEDLCPPRDATDPAWGRCFVEETLDQTLDCALTGEANLVRACEQRLACP